MNIRISPLLGTALVALGCMMHVDDSSAQLPPQDQFISQLDLSCYEVPGSAQDLGLTLQLTHLNPLLTNVPPHTGVVRQLRELCVPVAKNNHIPPTPILQYIQYVDLACYELLDAPPLNRRLDLYHLNPVVRQLLDPNGNPRPERVDVQEALKLCVPVAKVPAGGNPNIPPEVLNLIRYIDLECYRITDQPINIPLQLRQLNPLLTNLAPQNIDTPITSQELCVPVYKNNIVPPADVRPIIEVIDIKKYRVPPTLPLTVSFQIRHLNPLLVGFPGVQITQFLNPMLGLPVRKEAPPERSTPIMPWPAMLALGALLAAAGSALYRRNRGRMR
jgi:hypothetical protein